MFPTAILDTKAVIAIKQLSEIFSIFSNPKRIVADFETAFISNEFNIFCDNRGTGLHITAVGMP